MTEQNETAPAEYRYLIDNRGVVSFDSGAAREIFNQLKDTQPPLSTPENYDQQTGLHRQAQTFTLENPFAQLELTSHGAMVIAYTLHEGGSSIIYPPSPAGTPYLQGDELRGGGLIGYPHNCGYETDEANYHGYLPRTLAHPIVTENNLIIFALTPNMIPYDAPNPGETLTLISYQLNSDGSYTNTVQTFNFGSKATLTNEVFHPYFDTRNSRPSAIQVGNQLIEFSQYVAINEMTLRQALTALKNGFFEPMSNYLNADSSPPSITMFSQHYNVTLQPLEGFDLNKATLGIWTETFRRFLCLEAFVNRDETFEPNNPKKKRFYVKIKPNESSLTAVRISARLNQ